MEKYVVRFHNVDTDEWESFTIEAKNLIEAERVAHKKIIKEKIIVYQFTVVKANNVDY